MANSFKNYTKKEVGTSVTDVYTVGGSTTSVVIGITLANRSGNQINCDLILNVSSGDDVYLIRNQSILKCKSKRISICKHIDSRISAY